MANGYLNPWRRGSLSGGTSSGFGGGSLFDLQRHVNRLVDDLFDRGGGESSLFAGGALTAPALDVDQDDKQIEITAELPGVRQEDIDISIEDGVLTLSGEKKCERKEEGGYSERRYGRFERRITLPSNVDEDNCSADFRDGVLRITIPRAEEKNRARRIEIGSGRAQQPRRVEAQNDSQTAPRQQAAEESAREERGEDWKPEDQPS